MIGNNYDKRYWCQNVIFISNNGKTMNGLFEIYKYPYESSNPIIPENRIVFWRDTISSNFDYQDYSLDFHLLGKKG